MKRTLAFWIASAALAMAAEPGMDADDALRLLLEGNRRFVGEQPVLPKSTAARRAEIAGGQHPIAAIVGCADSRVPPELVFGEGLGRLFVVRTAGNVVSDYDLASLEYAARHLGVHLIVVLGHERCGAVDAAVQELDEPGKIRELLDRIEPAVKKARRLKGDLLKNAIAENVRCVVRDIENDDPVLARLHREGKIRVVGALYDLESGKVRLLP